MRFIYQVILGSIFLIQACLLALPPGHMLDMWLEDDSED